MSYHKELYNLVLAMSEGDSLSTDDWSQETREMLTGYMQTKVRYYRFKYVYHKPYQLSIYKGSGYYAISFGIRSEYKDRYSGETKFKYIGYYNSKVFNKSPKLRKYGAKLPIICKDRIEAEVKYNKIKNELINQLKLSKKSL